MKSNIAVTARRAINQVQQEEQYSMQLQQEEQYTNYSKKRNIAVTARRAI